MKIFEGYPSMENERLLIHKMSMDDAEALGALSHNPNVYRLEPTFLFEQKYDDPREVIARMDAECFETKVSILLGTYLKEDPETLIGIAEIYAYDPRKPKVSIGYRLNEPYWGKGIGTEAAGLLRDYLLLDTNVRTITAHVRKENVASAKILKRNGFLCIYPNCEEDWGLPKPVWVDKYILKRRWLVTQRIIAKVKGR